MFHRRHELAENLNKQLDSTAKTLGNMIQELNAHFGPTAEPDDPVQQIVKILNAHLNSLQWIDQNAGALQNRLHSVAKGTRRVADEQERLFRTRVSGTCRCHGSGF